jgi:hypothetical protein
MTGTAREAWSMTGTGLVNDRESERGLVNDRDGESEERLGQRYFGLP